MWRLGNKMPLFCQKINSFKHTDVFGYLDRQENSNKTSSNRNLSSSLKPIIWLLISYFQTLRHSKQARESLDTFRKLNTQGKRVLKADKNLNETAIDTRACLYTPRNNLLVLVKRIHKVHCTGKVSGSIM